MSYTSREVYEFISQQTNDPIVQWKTCTISGQPFPIYQSDFEFYDKISPTFAGQKFQISTPTLCPEERQRRRLNFRNERKLYKRTCDATGAQMISMYKPGEGYVIYERKYWWSDVRDPMSYGVDFDFSQTFSRQFDQLMRYVPHSSMNMANDNINSDYTCYSVSNKNVYMGFGPTENEDCMYVKFINQCKNCIDCLSTYLDQECYEGNNSISCYNCMFYTNCTNCRDCIMVENCNGCRNCIGCIGLTNKEFYYLNEYVGREKYEKILLSISPINSTSIEGLKKSFKDVISDVVLPYCEIQKCEGSFGDMLTSCNSCIFSFDLVNSEHCKYCWYNKNSLWSYDNVFNDPSGIRYCYENCSSLGERYMSTFFVLDCHDVYYSVECFNSSHLFGCIGLRNKQYCIFNRQYTKEEYEIQVAKIVTHMMTTGERGEFFHPSLSPFGYNETVAQEYYPIKEGELTKFGYKWSNYSSDPKIPDTAQVLRPGEMSDNDWNKLVDSDDIVRQVIICEVSGRPYMIQKAELEFYRKHCLPIPRKYPDIRHEERMRLRPGRTLYLRVCDCCDKEMLSVYDRDCEGKIYCEQCYQKEIFG